MKFISAIAGAAMFAACLVYAPTADGDEVTEEILRSMMRGINTELAAGGMEYRLGVAEYLMDGDHQGRTVFFDDRNFRLAHHFVPGDPRRGGFMEIRWINDLFNGATLSGLTAADTDAAIVRAMGTWQDVMCSDIPLNHLGSFNFDFGVVQNLVGFGGSQNFFADVTHAGWLPLGFFQVLFGPAATNVLGVTFTFTWIDQDGNPTDINNSGTADVAFREIYYNNIFLWQLGANVDVETVVLHEAGHGLSQGHFGKAFVTNSNNKLHFSPLSVMNAGYSGVQQELKGTDVGGHCSIWGGWPN